VTLESTHPYRIWGPGGLTGQRFSNFLCAARTVKALGPDYSVLDEYGRRTGYAECLTALDDAHAKTYLELSGAARL
jgi:hypothetical protein